jgi:hypothetical protein
LISCRRPGWAVVTSALVVCAGLSAPVVADEGGGLVGWVENTRGAPIAGAVVSIFGKGIRGGSLITLADSRGQFTLQALPAGSYTLRAVGTGHQPSAAQQVTVLPNRDALFTLSLTPVGEKAEAESVSEDAASEARREWRWLVRHKRRSALETAGPDADATAGPAAEPPSPPALADLGPLGGSMEFAATTGTRSLPYASGPGLPGGLGSLRLEGRLADGVRWNLGGLVAESEGRAWRMAAEFVIEPGGGHEVEMGAGYGAGEMGTTIPDALREPSRSLGAVFVRDRWTLSDRFTATAGARYTYVGFLPDSHHADAVLQIEVRGDERTRLLGSVAARTLAPGGDLLTLSTVAASPAITWARLEDGLRPARFVRCELGVDHEVGGATVGARIFDETARDLLLTTFQGSTPLIRNAGGAAARGFGVSIGHRFGGVVNGSVAYTFGRGRRAGGAVPFASSLPLMAFDEAEFHDLVARLETVIDWSDTRLAALYRLNALSEDGPSAAGTTGTGTSTSSRFDVQLTQGLPFLQPLTRADWEVLVAVRNMFYEASQAGFLDELAVQDPPTRVVGGISVRF